MHFKFLRSVGTGFVLSLNLCRHCENLITVMSRPLEKIATNDVQESIPPRGWNSYDMFSWIISEQDLLHNVENASQNLLQYGYQVGFFLFSKLFSYFP